MIKIWTTTKSVNTLEQVFGSAFDALKPNIPEHEFEKFSMGWVPQPPPGGVLLVCGKKLVTILSQKGVFPKNRTPTSLRGKPVQHSNGGWYLATFDPNSVAGAVENKAHIAWDVLLAHRLVTQGNMAPKLGDYKWVGSYAPLIERIKARFKETGQPVDVANDLETMGFAPYVPGKHIVSVSFTLEHGTAELLYTGPKFSDPVAIDKPEELAEQINWLYTTPMVRMRLVNGKFDMKWIRHEWGIVCTNFTFDAGLAGSLLDENRSNSLNHLTKVEAPTLGGYDDSFNSDYDKSKFEDIPPNDDFLTYAGGDTDATQRVSDRLKKKLLAQPRLANFYVNLLHPAARTFEAIEHRGVLVDKEKYAVLGDDLRKEIKSAQTACLKLLPRRLRTKYLDKIEDQLAKGKNPLTPKIKTEYFFGELGLNLKPKMFSEKTQAISTSAAHFELFADDPVAAEMMGQIKRLSKAEKALSTYVVGFLKHLHVDNRFHPSFYLYHGGESHSSQEGGTATGRLTCSDPAMQVVPKHHEWAKRIRECFPAPEGYLFFEVDYSQGELRIAACVAPEKGMIAAYKEGMDLHAITGALTAHVSYEQAMALKKSSLDSDKAQFKAIRQGGKAGNFGLLYGMQAAGFQSYAQTVYGVTMSLAEAEEFRNKFLYEQWSGLPYYHERIEKFVKNRGYVESPMGRVRHLPQVYSWDQSVASKAVRQAINAPIQAALNDIMLLALIEIENSFDESDVQVIGTIHDAAIGYVRASKAFELIDQVTEVMENLPLHKFGWKPDLQFPADASLGTRWHNLEEKPDIIAAGGLEAMGFV